MSGSSEALAEPPDPRRWAALVILLTGAFLAPLDFFIVNVAMPAIATGLHAQSGEVQLVISGYAVVYAVFLITGGRLGDIFGRKQIFLAGLAGFAFASALCGLAWSPGSLIGGRLIQALAAAAMAPQALASVHALFPAAERGRALAIYSFTLGLSSIAGQLLGGALVAADPGGFGWRLIFLINLPVAAVAFACAIPLLRDTRSPRRPRLDLWGIVLSAAALTSLVLPLIEGRERGWPVWSIVLLVAAPVFMEAFRRYEIRLARQGGEPLVAMDAFRAPGLLRAIGAVATLYAMAAFFLTFPLYLQIGLGRSALQAGIAILPLSAGFLFASFASPSVARWTGRASSSIGYLLCALGILMTARLVAITPAACGPPLALLAPTLAVAGFGMGTAIPMMMRVVIERVEPHRAGLVGGLFNSTLQVSAAIAVAVLGGVFFTVLGGRSGPGPVAEAFTATLVGVALCHLTGALLAAGLGQRRQRVPVPLSTVARSSA